MNKFLRTYLPAFSMAFTFIILYATISNIIAGYSKDRFCFFILQVFVYLMVSVIVDWLLSFIAEMIILYPITIGVAFIGKWFAFSAINITWYSCVYILIMIAIHCYFYHISKRQADEINKFLKLRNKR